MAIEDEVQENIMAPRPEASPKSELRSRNSSSHPQLHTPEEPSPTSKKPPSQEDFIISVASNIASQPLQNSDPDVWGVLTAISAHARKRRQGINVLLTDDEHCMGRVVDDKRFQIESMAVSGKHCKIYRKNVSEGEDKTYAVLKDISTNGTYLNSEKLNKNTPEAKLCHGDIISFSAAPHSENAFAFVYREVRYSTSLSDGAVKRKAEEFGSESKRLRGIGIGAPEGPISLDDFRSLQRSNMELRKQLENQVLTVETLRNENRATIERHENQKKDLKESVTKSFIDQLNELHHMMEVKQKELLEVNRILAEQKHAVEDLNERLGASIQSCSEANEIMNSQKASISELKAQLDEERDQRKEEREKAARDLKAALQKAQLETQEELRRISEASLRREKEQEEVINKLQESEKETCLLVETLRSKLEDTRKKLFVSDNKVRQLESQVCEEQLVSSNGRERIEELEHEVKSLRKDLESEKAAREEAWAKVSILELEINAVTRNLDYEQRKLRGARERIMLRETQLRAFYSTTEEISNLFTKQQEQLKAMQRTLEDEENYENTSVEIDAANGNMNGSPSRNKEARFNGNSSNDKAGGSSSSAQRFKRSRVEVSTDEDSVTEKHECGIIRQKDQNTQEVEFKGTEDCVKGGFGSDICCGTEPLEGDPIETERVLETESPGIEGERNIDLNKCSTLAGDTLQLDDDANVDFNKCNTSAGDTMQLDDEDRIQEKEEQDRAICGETVHGSQSNIPEHLKELEDTEAGGTIRTADLLTSEVAGSWACSTAPSVHGENESPRSRDGEEGAVAIHDSNGIVAESQSTPSSRAVSIRRDHERKALGEMIGIVAPELRDQFSGATGDFYNQGKQDSGSTCGSDTVDTTDDDDDNMVPAKGGSISDSETQGSDQADAMDEDDEATREDSLG